MKELSNELKSNLIADVENILEDTLSEDTKIALARCFEITIGLYNNEQPSDEDIKKWAEETSSSRFVEIYSKIEGAKAMRDGKIIHYDDGRPIVKI